MDIINPSYEIITPKEQIRSFIKVIEAAGRVCYKSEDKITEDSAGPFVDKICNVVKHHSVIEHSLLTVRFICDRGVSHELVRHRLAAFSQESTRYCVAGHLALTTSNPHRPLTVSELYEKRTSSRNGAWKRVKIRQVDDETGELCFGNVEDIVCNGKKPTLRIKTRLGYSWEGTADHEIKAQSGYIEAGALSVGDKIAVNGTDLLYQNHEWLSHHYSTLNKTASEISREFGFNVSTIKKWVQKHELPAKPRSYWNVGRTPWNKGVDESDPRVAKQAASLRDYHWNGGNPSVSLKRSERIKKLSKRTYHKVEKESCHICGSTRGLQVHHIDEDRENNSLANLLPVCPSHHQRIHSKNLEVSFLDEIVSIEDAGVQDVYDISMAGKNKNFAANGVLVHNCSYNKDKFGNQITLIRPCFLEQGSEQHALWMAAMKAAEEHYFWLLAAGAKPQEARSVLPNSLKTEVVMTANFREWKHVFAMRCAESAHPQMRELMIPLHQELSELVPEIFK